MGNFDLGSLGKDIIEVGWLPIMLAWLVKELFPAVWGSIVPAAIKSRQDKESADLEAKKARESMEEEERQHRWQLEDRQAQALEDIATSARATQSIAQQTMTFLDLTARRMETLEKQGEKTAQAIAIILDRIGREDSHGRNSKAPL